MTQDLHATRRYYDTFSERYEAHRHAGYHRWLDTRTVALLRPHVEGRRVLEVGCGTGLLLREVATDAKDAVGLDLSQGMLGLAASRGLRVLQGSATALPFEDHTFDLVYSFKVLAHVPDLEGALREMARVTRPGGRLVLEFYNRDSLRHVIRRVRPAGTVGHQTTEDDVYTRFHGLDELRSLLPPELMIERTHGLRVVTLVPQAFAVPMLGDWVARLEDALSASPLHRLAGFLVLSLLRR